MRYGRISIDGESRWVRVDDDAVHVLRSSPLEGDPVVERSRALEGLAFLPPVVPFVFYAVGLNYRRHIEEQIAAGRDVAVPDRPEVGYRANNALIGHGESILVPPDVTGRFEAEGEVVAVLGRRLRNASRAEAQESVFGWTIGNDVSAREWQRADRSFWRSKNSDTFKPMGPWIETDVDPMVQTTTVRVNGDVTSRIRHRRHGLRPVGFHRRGVPLHHLPSRRRAVDGSRLDLASSYPATPSISRSPASACSRTRSGGAPCDHRQTVAHRQQRHQHPFVGDDVGVEGAQLLGCGIGLVGGRPRCRSTGRCPPGSLPAPTVGEPVLRSRRCRTACRRR